MLVTRQRTELASALHRPRCSTPLHSAAPLHSTPLHSSLGHYTRTDGRTDGRTTDQTGLTRRRRSDRPGQTRPGQTGTDRGGAGWAGKVPGATAGDTDATGPGRGQGRGSYGARAWTVGVCLGVRRGEVGGGGLTRERGPVATAQWRGPSCGRQRRRLARCLAQPARPGPSRPVPAHHTRHIPVTAPSR